MSETKRMTFEEYVKKECERQWKENQEDEYGPWCQRSSEEQKEYFDSMYQQLSYMKEEFEKEN